MKDRNKLVTELTKRLIDEGKLIEAGWVAYRMLVLPDDAGPVQIDETRKAFFAGAQHVFGSVISMLDPGAEPTDADLGRMDSINNELNAYLASLTA